MDPIMAVFILVGFSALLAGCAGPENKNKVHLEIEPIQPITEEDSQNELLQKEENQKTTNENMMVKCTSGGEKVIPLMDANGDYVQNGEGEIETDINLGEEGFSQCCTPPDENIKCMPDIENNRWQCTDEKCTSNACNTVNSDSFMFCLHGYGIIYVYEDGQQEGEMQAFGAFRVMELWLEEGYNTISAERLKRALEDARNYGEQKSIKNFNDCAGKKIKDIDEKQVQFTEFDTSILAWTNFWNARQMKLLGAGNYTPVRAEIIKCIMMKESSMGTNGEKNGKRDVTQSLFHGDPTIWVITKLNPYAEGKTHEGDDPNSQVIDVIFEEKKVENGEEKNKVENGSIPPEFEPNDVRYQEWFDNGGWKIYSEVITNQEGQCYKYYHEKVFSDMSICSGIGVYSYYLNELNGLTSEAKAAARYKGSKVESENREYVEKIEYYMNSMGESVDGYDEYMETH